MVLYCKDPWILGPKVYSSFWRQEEIIFFFNLSSNRRVIYQVDWRGEVKYQCLLGLPHWLSNKESTCNARDLQEMWVRSLGWEDPLERKWQPTPVFLPGKSHGQRSLAGYSPWGHKGLDTTVRLSSQSLSQPTTYNLHGKRSLLQISYVLSISYLQHPVLTSAVAQPLHASFLT